MPTASSDRSVLTTGDWTPGRTVTVRNRFTGGWSAGFTLAETPPSSPPQFRVRRMSDDAVLPETFTAEELRLT